MKKQKTKNTAAADGGAPLLINRELSWLEFNQRVLQEALDPAQPLLQRLFFLSVTASNLDEFFMVRVGGLHLQAASGIRRADPSGLSPAEQLQRVRLRVRHLIRDQYECLSASLLPELALHGVRVLPAGAALPGEVAQPLSAVFAGDILPLITPVAIAPGAPFPLLAPLQPHLAVRLAGRPERLAVIRLAPPVPRLWRVASADGAPFRYAFIEDILRAFLPSVFPGRRVLEAAVFRITRNADMPLNEEYAADLASAMSQLLRLRKSAPCVRLEVEDAASEKMSALLARNLGADPDDILRIPGPVDLTALRALPNLPDLPHLQSPPWPPQPNPDLDPTQDIFAQIARRDILLNLPYESFDPVVRLVESAAKDPQVLAIKIVLYRTSSTSPIIRALASAALAGKLVTAILELKARFDEARNIDWARGLEEAGVQVVYGIQNLKTHAKVCLVLRREDGVLRHYLHLGTGNYNESTARLYTDVGLLSADLTLGRDASAFFHAVTGQSEPQAYQNLSQSPTHLRDRLLGLIRFEADTARRRQPAKILAKMNALVDPELIHALCDASSAGVKIHLCVRGVCCLRPGIPGVSDNITVTSVVDRLLEHSRVFYFYHNGAEEVYFSSADWMPRNLDRRIELMVNVTDPACKRRLVEILNATLSDTLKAWVLNPDGEYTRVAPPKKAAPLRSQEFLYQAACAAQKAARKSMRTRFIPHLPERGNC
ncbi:MAG: polyphosphate kinase 1 [Kiritimatiellaeota bacterium]|nr:polyphosphate kinase 1 [Kiritimatiellota bacterium]